jgi:hypothetical protein
MSYKIKDLMIQTVFPQALPPQPMAMQCTPCTSCSGCSSCSGCTNCTGCSNCTGISTAGRVEPGESIDCPGGAGKEQWSTMRDDIARVLDVLGGKLLTPSTPEDMAWLEERVRTAVTELRA